MGDTTNDLAARRKLIWDLSQERRAHARHSETLRSNVSSYTMVAASGLVTVITYDRIINRHDVALAVLLAFIGLLGALFAAAYTERYHRNRRRASDLLKELDREISVADRLTTGEIENKADEVHYQHKRFSVVRGLSSTHWLWLAFPLMVFVLGVVLTIVAWEHWDADPAEQNAVRHGMGSGLQSRKL